MEFCELPVTTKICNKVLCGIPVGVFNNIRLRLGDPDHIHCPHCFDRRITGTNYLRNRWFIEKGAERLPIRGSIDWWKYEEESITIYSCGYHYEKKCKRRKKFKSYFPISPSWSRR